MNRIQEYINYLKDNPEGYWFKRKSYGWGWTPALWQGWAVLGAFLFYIAWVAVRFANLAKQEALTNDEIYGFMLKVILATAVLIILCYQKGEKPRWQWGIPKRTDTKDL